MKLQPDAVCAGCGHQKRHHWGDGPCIAYTGKGEGKVNTIAGSVCPCDTFKEKA